MKVKLSPVASIFHDMETKLTISGKSIVELTPKQMASSEVVKALRSGHLVEVNDHKNEAQAEPAGVDVQTLQATLDKMVANGDPAKTIAGAFNMDQLKALAAANDIELEKGDTKLNIVEALVG